MSVLGHDDAILVTGAGGFIGGHLVRRLRQRGHTRIRAVDAKPLESWHQLDAQADNRQADLRARTACEDVMDGIDHVFNFAADMGGMGYIETHKAECMLSVLINTHLLLAARHAGTQRFFYASSACVYNADKQADTDVTALRETDAYPAAPEDGYGWEKLFGERMCRHFMEDFGLETRVARFHNVYGPNGAWRGGREKAPAAICRKVAEAVVSGSTEIEIWGDGRQTRSFTYVDDCIEGTLRLMESDVREPLNIGSSELVSINDLVSLVEDTAGVKLERRYDTSAPQGVRGRNSDNTLIRERLGWEPSTSLASGMAVTYEWVKAQLLKGAS
jgi:nucleoside-diphosphate-sugar epimerase